MEAWKELWKLYKGAEVLRYSKNNNLHDIMAIGVVAEANGACSVMGRPPVVSNLDRWAQAQVISNFMGGDKLVHQSGNSDAAINISCPSWREMSK